MDKLGRSGSILDEQITRRKLLEALGLGATALSLGPILAACSSGSNSGGQLPSTLTWALPGPVLSIDYSYADVTSNYAHPMSYEGLLVFMPDGSLKPWLASSWSQVDPVTYVYKLRDGVKFWDGSLLTVQDVIASWNRTADPVVGSGWSSFFNTIQTMSESNPGELTVKLKNPDPLFQYIPGFGGSRISSKKFLDAHPKDNGTTPALTMGTGPYKFTEYVKDDHLTLQSTGSYWGTAPTFKTITIQSIADANNKLLAMRSGSIDGTFTISLDQVEQYKGLPNATTLFAPEFSVYMFQMDSQKAPFDDVHVRRAFAYSLDRAGLVASVLHGYGQPASALPSPDQWVGPGLLSKDRVDTFYASLPAYRTTFDLQKAKAELAQSAHANGFTVSILYPDSDQSMGLFCQNLAQNLKQIGVTLNVKEAPSSQWNNNLNSRLNNFFVMKWSTVTSDASEIPSAMFDSRSATVNQYNLANLKSPAMDALLSQERSAVDTAKRSQLLQQIIQMEADFCGWIPIVWPQTAAAIKSTYTFDQLSTWARWEDWAARIHTK